MIISDSTRGGLTNKDALRIFIKKFDEFIEKIESFIPSKEDKLIFLNIMDYIFISYLVIICLCQGIKILVISDTNQSYYELFVIIIVIVIYFSVFICNKVLKKEKIKCNLLSLREEMNNYINSCTHKSSVFYTNLEEYKGNYYYDFDNCFIKTLRNQEWVKVPKNVIVEGDFIKINIGERSPADVRCVDYRYTPMNQKWDFCLKKDEIFKGFEESLSFNSNIELFLQNKYDKIFTTKDEWLFEVINDPFLETLEIYVKNYYSKSLSKDFSDSNKEIKILKYILFIFFNMLLVIMLFWIFYNLNKTNNQCVRNFFIVINHPLIFFVAFIFIYFDVIKVFLIYWSNAAIYILKKNILNKNSVYTEEKHDELIENLNYKNTNCQICTVNPVIPSTEKNKEYYKVNSCPIQTQQGSNSGIITYDKEYFNLSYFNEFSFKEHLSFYIQFFQEGIEMTYNLLNISGPISRICFLDKSGLMFEKEKEVVEIAFLKSNNNVEVLNVNSDPDKRLNLNNNEINYYQIEEYNTGITKLKEEGNVNVNNLKPIALSCSVIKIPYQDCFNTVTSTNELIFLELNKIKNLKRIMPVSKIRKYLRLLSLKGMSTYLYSAVDESLKIHLKDCLCLLSKSIGFTDNLIKSYSNIKNLWHTNFLKFESSEYETERKMIVDNLDETEESIVYESGVGPLNDPENDKVDSEDEGDLIITSVVKDETSSNISYFTRGRPISVLKLCEDFWNGNTIEPLRGEIIQKINSLIQQWQSSNIQSIAFSYKPTKAGLIDIIEKFNMDIDISDKKILNILKHNSLPQIFLGMVAVKNNMKVSFQDLLETLNEAGIIFVFFSKEDENNTKKLADIIMCEYDFNQCISLGNKSNLNSKKITEGNNLNLNQVNQEGNKYLPTGVNEIRDFLLKKDEVPLQINLFSDSNIDDVVDVLHIYQEYGEIIGCFTSTLNNENIPALAVADINFGINIKPSFQCGICHGIRNDFMRKCNPTIFEYLSMKINSIFCPFVIDENTNYACLTRIISAARFLNYRKKLVMKFFISIIYYFIFLQLPSYILMTRYIIDNYSIMYFIFLVFPLQLFSMLTINKSFDHIKKMKSSKRVKEKLLEHQSGMFKTFIHIVFNILIIVSNIIILNAIYFIKLNDYVNYIQKNFYLMRVDVPKNLSECIFNYFWNFTYDPNYLKNNFTLNLNTNYTLTKVYNLNNEEFDLSSSILENLDYLNVIIFYLVTWFITCLSFVSIDKLQSVFSFFFFKNYKFIVVNFIILIISTIIFLIRYLRFSNSVVIKFGNEDIILLTFSMFFIFIFDFIKKIYYLKLSNAKQKNIKMIIETRLGTYSPK